MKTYKTTTKDKLDEALVELSPVYRCRKRISKRGVPHLVGELSDGSQFSITWFWKYRNYLLFYPYPNDNQKKMKIHNADYLPKAVHKITQEK